MKLTTDILRQVLVLIEEESKSEREPNDSADSRTAYIDGVCNGRIGLAQELMEILESAENSKGE